MISKIIIVGGGTSGAIIAKKLSDNFEVVVFERNKKKNIPLFYRIPLLIGLLLSKKNNFVKKLDIKFSGVRFVPFFESQSLGGASVINGCVHVMGSHSRWVRLLSRFRLSLDNLHNSYKNLYSKDNENDRLVLSENVENKLDGIFFRALKAVGLSKGDVEWADFPAYGSVFNTVGRIFRSSVLSIEPFRNVKIKSGFEVDHLIVDDAMKILGVHANGEMFFSDAVILSAGVLGTNTLLMKKALRFSDKSFIDLGLDVGERIKDHTNLRINVDSLIKINSLNEINSNVIGKISLFLRHLAGHKTLMMGTGATSAAHLDLDDDGQVDARIQLLNFSETGRMGSQGNLFSSKMPGFSISITVINPMSFGKLSASKNSISIEPNYLSERLDIDHLKRCLDFVIKLLESNAFKEVVCKIHQIEEIRKDPTAYILENAYSGYHLIGGCGNLVGEDFQVDCLEGLYICDASILTEYVSSNIHSTVVLLADMFAEKLVKNNLH